MGSQGSLEFIRKRVTIMKIIILELYTVFQQTLYVLLLISHDLLPIMNLTQSYHTHNTWYSERQLVILWYHNCLLLLASSTTSKFVPNCLCRSTQCAQARTVTLIYTVTMTHIICSINISCCSLNQALYHGFETIQSSKHQSSHPILHMRRVDQ